MRLLALLLIIVWAPLTLASDGLEVSILQPHADQPLFGQIEVDVAVGGTDCVEFVELRVDGRPAGRLTEPPFRFAVDVGQENRQHRLLVTAQSCRGRLAGVELISPAIDVDEVVDIDLQQLYVTVTDGRGRRIIDLPGDAFEIRDDGVRQELVTFAGGEIPFVATLLVDASGSMRGEALQVALRGARAFAEGMAENDEVKVVLHDDLSLASTGFQPSARPLLEALAEVEAGDGTAILDAFYSALLELERRQGRRVVVLLSDGWDLHSVIDAEQLELLARSSQALIYWVRFGSEQSGSYAGGVSTVQRRLPMSAWRDLERFRRLERRLERLVHRSGGRVQPVFRLDQVEAVFRDILQELREQYALGYYPAPRRNDGSWRRVRVNLSRPGLELRVREGYVDR